MAQHKLLVPLMLGIGVMSDDPSDVRIQKDIVDAARRHNIKSLDTARHYVRPLPYSKIAIMLKFFLRQEVDQRSSLATVDFHPSFRSRPRPPQVLYLALPQKRGY
jgi:hypothetical protein